MEVNNYQRIFSYLTTLGNNYINYPVLLFYRKKKRDFITEEEYNGFKKLEFFENIRNINMDNVISLCKENKCRCYITIIDQFVLKVFGKMSLTLKNLDKFLQSEMKRSRGLHLIDLDNPVPNMSKLSEILEQNGAANLCIFPSKTGNSLVFYGPGEIISIYNERIDLGAENNQGHEICQLNLYIPEFYGE